MKVVQGKHPRSVTGPLGEELTREKLPPAQTSRWVARRKAEVVTAIEGGLLTVAEARARYNLTFEELVCWQRDYGRGGLRGLHLASMREARRAGGSRSCVNLAGHLQEWKGSGLEAGD